MSKLVAAMYCGNPVAVTNNGESFWDVFFGFKFASSYFSILGRPYEYRIVHIK
jgi:hypothetical protein